MKFDNDEEVLSRGCQKYHPFDTQIVKRHNNIGKNEFSLNPLFNKSVLINNNIPEISIRIQKKF